MTIHDATFEGIQADSLEVIAHRSTERKRLAMAELARLANKQRADDKKALESPDQLTIANIISPTFFDLGN